MSDNPIIVESDLEGSVSSSSKKGVKSESHSFPYISECFELGIITLSDDSSMEDLSGESLSDVALFTNTSESLFPTKFDEGENLVES